MNENSNTLPSRPTYSYTEDDWIQLRAHFMGSILVEVNLHKLAQNIGASWPIKDKDETPARYLDHSFEELINAPGINGQPSRLQLLLDILKETASFDDPFQEMVPSVPTQGQSGTTSEQMLSRLAIPPEYPVEFSALTIDTRSLCEAEGAETLKDAVTLFQSMAQSIIVGGEVRQFLNSLSHGDLHVLSQYLPVRPGTRGLHLAEAIGVFIRSLPESARLACIESPVPGTAPSPAAEAAFERLRARLPALLGWFPEEANTLRDLCARGEPVERFFVTLGQADLENAAARLARSHFGVAAPVVQEVAQAPGLMGRLSRFFRSS